MADRTSSSPEEQSAGERMAQWHITGRCHPDCEIGGFTAIGEPGRPPEAYVAGRDIAERIVHRVNGHDVLIAALKLIAKDGCRRRNWLTGSGGCAGIVSWSKDAEYVSDRWCDPCIAAEAIEAAKAEGR